jgi:hypothetical protein
MTDSQQRPSHELHGVLLCGLCLLLGWLSTAAWAQSAALGNFEVGQRWEYRHEGPRPGDVEPNAIDGQRILRVISAADEQKGRQWIIEERFTNGPQVIGRSHINAGHFLTRTEIENNKGEVAHVKYEPLIPYRVLDLAVGAKRTMETTVTMEGVDFKLPLVITMERLADETIGTPAGEFTGCRHYRTTTLSTINIKIGKIRSTEEREQWFHDSVHGMVKEVYRKGAVKFLTWSRPAYTATSTLVSFTKEKGPIGGQATSQAAARESRPPAPANTTTGVPKPNPRRWILRGGIAILVLGSFLLVRQARRRRHTS